jgi:hypothetical protein
MHRFALFFMLLSIAAAPALAQSGPAVRAAPVGAVTAEAVPDPERLPVPADTLPQYGEAAPADTRVHKDKRRWARPIHLQKRRNAPAATR